MNERECTVPELCGVCHICQEMTHETKDHVYADRGRRFWQEQGKWSIATFGPTSDRGPEGALKHLAKEVAETQANPTDRFEYADCLFLIFDASRRAGLTYDTLMDTAFEKLEINKKRKWARPAPGEPVEHIREEESWSHKPNCLLANADAVDEAILLANLGPCPCSPAGQPK